MSRARVLADFVGGGITGTVLQTVSHTETDFTTFTNPGTARTDLLLLASNAADSTSHVSASITPISTNSKILIQVCVYLWDIYRDSTKLGSPKVGNRGGGIASTGINASFSGSTVIIDAASTPETRFYQFMDSPNSTSAITYAAAYNTSSASGSVHLNSTVSDTDSTSFERGVSSIILQEIAG